MSRFRRGKKIIGWSATCVLLLIIVCNIAVIWNARGKTFNNPGSLPVHHLGLLLGTSPITPNGVHNFSFDNRIKSASEIYKAGKIKKLIVSGGDYTQSEKFGCDEPRAMRDSLIASGVRAEDIFMDYEGLTTIRSLAKLKNYYSYGDTVTLISQSYHNPRAIVMAARLGLPAVAYSVAVPPNRFNKIKNYAREMLARVKMLATLYIIPLPDASSFNSDDKEKFNEFLSE